MLGKLRMAPARRAAIGITFAILAVRPALAVHVDDFGATGDDDTWDHQAIQAAITAAGPGGLVEFGAGKVYLQCAQVAPLAGQTLRGHGATLKRCDPPTTRLTADAPAGALTLVVEDPTVFVQGMSLTPVKGAGGYEDGEFVINHFLTATTGNTLTITRGLAQDYPAGSLVTVKFDQLYVNNTSLDVTVDGLNFDGTRDSFSHYLSWTDNNAIRGAPGLTLINSELYDLPGNGIAINGTNVSIRNNEFRSLDGPIAHLSGTDPVNGSLVSLSGNFAMRTNLQAERMQHSEGVITISVRNIGVEVINNTIIDAPVPFISPFHDDMRDWLVQDNFVYGTSGAFFAIAWRGTSLTNVVFEGNQFFNVGPSTSERRPTGPPITEFVFRNNRIIGGSLQLDGLLDGDVSGNVIKSCRVTPLAVTNSTNVTLEDNVVTSNYCLLDVQATATPDEIGAPGGEVGFRIDITNRADADDAAALNGVSVLEVTDQNGAALPGLACSSPIPFSLIGGRTGSCSFTGEISGSVGQTVTRNFLIRARIDETETAVAGSASATVRVLDRKAPLITLLGESPARVVLGEPYVERGATASDETDGDVTTSVLIDSEALRVDKRGTYSIVYTARDSAGNIAEAIRTVDVLDMTPPTIQLLGEDLVRIAFGNAYAEAGATALDNADGDLSSTIRIDATALRAAPGTYSVFYDVSDESGNAAARVSRTVVVVDEIPPAITLSGANPQQIVLGESYRELGSTVIDNADGDISQSVRIDASGVNTGVEGTYQVRYEATDQSGNQATPVFRSVRVEARRGGGGSWDIASVLALAGIALFGRLRSCRAAFGR